MANHPDKRQAGAEIEVTREMIAAGASCLAESGWIEHYNDPLPAGLLLLVRDVVAETIGGKVRLKFPTDRALTV